MRNVPIKKTKISTIKEYFEKVKFKLSNSNNLLDKYKNCEYLEEIKNNKDFYLIISQLTAQSKSSKQENRICTVLDGMKIKAEADKGDFVDKNGDFFEIKCSTPSKDGNILNVVQIRLHQPIEYYICAFIDDIDYKNNFVFKLTKEQMKEECNLIGNSAHGAAKKQQINKEMRFSIIIDDTHSKTTKRWLEKYRDNKLERKIF